MSLTEAEAPDDIALSLKDIVVLSPYQQIDIGEALKFITEAKTPAGIAEF